MERVLNWVGGADADLILDDILIEIKVTKKLELRREYFNQLIGYYLLSLVGGVNGNTDIKPIKRIGVYFARHGYLWQIPLSEIAPQKTFDEFLVWFADYVKRTGDIHASQGTHNLYLTEVFCDTVNKVVVYFQISYVFGKMFLWLQRAHDNP